MTIVSFLFSEYKYDQNKYFQTENDEKYSNDEKNNVKLRNYLQKQEITMYINKGLDISILKSNISTLLNSEKYESSIVIATFKKGSAKATHLMFNSADNKKIIKNYLEDIIIKNSDDNSAINRSFDLTFYYNNNFIMLTNENKNVLEDLNLYGENIIALDLCVPKHSENLRNIATICKLNIVKNLGNRGDLCVEDPIKLHDNVILIYISKNIYKYYKNNRE